MNITGVDFLDISDTEVTSINGNLVLEDVDDLLDTVNTEDVGVHERTAETNSLDTERQKLEDVSAVADTTVGKDLDLLEDLGGLLVDLKSDLKAGGAAVELATTVVGENDSGSTVLDSKLGVLGGTNALDDDGELGHLLELLVVVPGDVGVRGVSGANTETGSAVSVAVGGRVDGEDDGSGTSLLGAVKLLEDNLTLGLGLGDLLDGERGVEGGHVKDVTSGGTLYKVLLSIGVSVATLGARADEERSREVVAQDGGGQCALDVGDVDHDTGLKAVSLEDLEVVAVGPLAGSTVTVVGVVLDGEVVLSRPLKVRETDHLVKLGELALGEISENQLETSVGLLEERTSSHGTRDKGAGEDLATHSEC
ncbi:hypothetical protein HG530_011238 [Fusarium avenaceum]|nr:hypothetical protein HG530_011238 [Fusarium avenaceum]